MMNRMLAVGSLLALALVITGCQKPLEKGPPKKKQGVKAPVDPQPANHLGKPFTRTTRTTIATLVADPKAFKGKTVRVAGVLVAYCHHRKAWFAMAPSKDSMIKLQVQTVPAFRVPDDVEIGVTRTEAEGVIELRTVPEAHAKPLAKSHGLFGGDPSRLKGPQFLPRLKAAGASFR